MREMATWWKLVFWARVLSVCIFLVVSFKLNLYTLVSFCLVLLSFYGLERNIFTTRNRAKPQLVAREELEEEDAVPAKVVRGYKEAVAVFVLQAYDPGNCVTLDHFKPVQTGTECVFAKRAKLWGGREYDSTLTLEDNILKSVPALIKFMAIGEYVHLDGFVLELPGEEFGHDVKLFGQAVYKTLKCLSDSDPSKMHCMSVSYVGQKGWSFVFNRETIFVTTFAPCYLATSSRYAFGAEHCFVLLQPTYSFVHHSIGIDTPHTNWEAPRTARDRIRKAYRDGGRPYHIRDTIYYPMAHDVVKPLCNEGTDLIEWWKMGHSSKKEE